MLDKEILDGFKEETNQLMEELVEVVEKLEIRSATFPADLLQQFAQRIDRVMGAAKTMSQMDEANQGLQRIGKISELCKRMGYMAADMKNPKLIPLFAAFWADTVETIQELIEVLDDNAKMEEIIRSQTKIVQGRLEWLAKQVDAAAPKGTSTAAPSVAHKESVTAAAEEKDADLGGESFADLMKDLELD